MFKSLLALFFLVLSLLSCPLWGQEEARSIGEHPWALTLDVAPNFGYDISGVSVAMERRLLGSPSKHHQVGVRFGAQDLNVDFFGVIQGQGIHGGAFLLLGQTHFLDLHAGGALVYDTNPRGSNFGFGSAGSGDVGWEGWPLLSLGYRYVSPDPDGKMVKVGIGTLGVYVGFGVVVG